MYNVLVALVKRLDGIFDDDIVGLDIPTRIPLRCDLDVNVTPRVTGGASRRGGRR